MLQHWMSAFEMTQTRQSVLIAAAIDHSQA
jgi:hypothetical protein